MPRIWRPTIKITTSGTDERMAQQGGMVDLITKSVVYAVFGFSGFASYKHKNFFAVPTVSDNERKAMLTELRQLIHNFI
ncbi:MAG TPA: hypothetical protein VN426_04205 [Syntrophomonadaceae bacterium]|nr:hypothetical protein [Syntrophomonadaceae bacterium]